MSESEVVLRVASESVTVKESWLPRWQFLDDIVTTSRLDYDLNTSHLL